MGDMMLVNDSIILVNAISTVYVFNKNRYSFTEIKIPANGKTPWARNVVSFFNARFFKDAKRNIFLGSDYLYINLNHYKMEVIPPDMKSPLPPGAYVSNATYDSRGNAWRFFYGKNLLLTKTISDKPVKYPFVNTDGLTLENMINDFFEDGDRMWICTGAGLVFYDYLHNNFYRYRQQPGNEKSLSNNRVQCMIKDKNGLYWVGTFGGGVCYFRVKQVFKNIVIDTNYFDEERKVYGLQALYSGRVIVGVMNGKRFMLERNKTIHPLDYARDFKTPPLAFAAILLLVPFRVIVANEMGFPLGSITRPLNHAV